MNLEDYEAEKDKAFDVLKRIFAENIRDRKTLQQMKRQMKYSVSNLVLQRRYQEALINKELPEDKSIQKLLQKQHTRSASGITAVTILMKPWGCQGLCVYCPTEARMPKSYLSGEPGVMRAVRNDWDAKRQTETRLRALQLMGHDTDKNELIILGGTFSNYPREYVNQFILGMFEALNGEASNSIEEAQIKNENAKNRCIGLSIETRPDCVTEEEIIYIRWLGATKIEMGVQTVYDDVSEKIKRGHNMESVYQATQIIKDAGFKIHYHMMPNLPGSTIEKDVEMFRILFTDQRLQPDMLKIYPCVVVDHSELKEIAERGEYQAYSDADVMEMLIALKQHVPHYCRIMRLGRDIPAYNITQGNTITNIREVIHRTMKERGIVCKCIRCREVGFRPVPDAKIEIRETIYDASNGKEHFLEYYHPDTESIFAFVRLRIPSQYFSGKKHFIPELEACALIRELHTYGKALEIGKEGESAQHKGLGKQLLLEAEKIAREKYSLKKIAVIAGIGTREYYRKLGYELEGLYMTKKL